MKSKLVHKPSKPVAAVKGAAPKKIAISAGVAGNRLSGMTPQYPAIKRKANATGKAIAKANKKT